MKVIIFGLNECAELAKFYLENDSEFTPHAFTVNGEFVKEESLNGLPVIPYEEIDQTSFSTDDYKFFAPLYDNSQRKKTYLDIKSKSYDFISYVSSKATCWSDVGENCFIMEDNTIQPFVQIGNNVILWSGNHVGHHSVIGDHSFISSHVVISGNCSLGEECWLGVNSSIKDNLTLANGTFLAMSSCLVSNTKSYTKYKGSPAKPYGDNR